VPATDLDGNEVEGHDGKVLYVWFDAPIGYISASIEWARDIVGDAEAWRRYWVVPADQDVGSGPRLVHFIGKDNIPFHCIVFPAMLGWQKPAREGETFLGPGANERWVLPDNVPSNEFYNLEGRKFSTSDNWMLDSARMFDLFGADALRWYLTKSMPETADSHFTFDGLQASVNAELADTLGNYASRVLKFTRSHLGGVVPEPDTAHALAPDMAEAETACAAAVETVGRLIDRFEFRKAAASVVDLGRFGNKLFDGREPWKLRKTDMPGCSTALWCHIQVLGTLSVVLAPFVPEASARLRAMLALPELENRTGLGDRWATETLPAGHALGEPGILFAKIPDELVEAEREALGAGT
jgi:methionyl-tRNA synthetase